MVRIQPQNQLCKKKNSLTPLLAPIQNFVKFRKIELSNSFSCWNQKSFKTPQFYTKIHQLSREEIRNPKKVILCSLYCTAGPKLLSNSFTRELNVVFSLGRVPKIRVGRALSETRVPCSALQLRCGTKHQQCPGNVQLITPGVSRRHRHDGHKWSGLFP